MKATCYLFNYTCLCIIVMTTFSELEITAGHWSFLGNGRPNFRVLQDTECPTKSLMTNQIEYLIF